MMWSCYLFYLLHWLNAKGVLHVRLADVLFRLMSLLMLILPFKWISFRGLSPVPSFFLVLQAHSFFLKSFSFYSVIASAEEDGTAKEELLNLRNFSYFILAPTLVYRTKGYPKSDKIRIGFLLMQILRVFYKAGKLSLLESIVLLTLPAGSLYLALFFITFEVALNIFAEVTFFADHYFYEDWWNSLSYDEFSRKWNRPVHEWLAQHVYKRARIRGFSRMGGIAYTTLFSAIFHEIILAITFGKFRLYMTMMMMLQIPLMLGMKLIMRKDSLVRKRIVNTFFWFGMFIGPAILITFNVYDCWQLHFAQLTICICKFWSFLFYRKKTDSARDLPEHQAGASSSLSSRVKARVDPLPLQNVLPNAGSFLFGSNQSSAITSWPPGSILSPAWVNYGGIPDNAFIVSPSIFVETPTKHFYQTHEGVLGDMASTHVSTPNSLTGTPHYIQQQEQQEESYHFPRDHNIESCNLSTEEENENPINTLAAISESRLPFQTEQATSGAAFAFQQSYAQQSSKADSKSTNNDEDSSRKSGSKRWLFGTNKSFCSVPEKVGKKPRPRGYSMTNNSDMLSLETPSLSTCSNVAKTEPLLMNYEPRCNNNMVPSMFIPSSSVVNSSFPAGNANMESSLANRYRRSTVLEDSSKLSMATYADRGFSSMSQYAPSYLRMAEEGRSTNSLRMREVL
ncbi:hypothetical protein Gasu2_54720 [Galdieria sulphuraria]|nr:hypothetical protein Gasu2_54720 [Galdieria sulphuraria]